MEILSREQDASYIEAKGFKNMALEILGHREGIYLSGYTRKVSDECARHGIYKLRKNDTLWALLSEEPTFVDSLKVLDLELE